MELRKEPNLCKADAPDKMMRANLAWMLQSGGSYHVRKGSQCIAVEIMNPVSLLWNDKRSLADGILCRNPNRTAIGIAGQRLDAAEGEHESSSCIRPVRT